MVNPEALVSGWLSEACGGLCNCSPGLFVAALDAVGEILPSVLEGVLQGERLIVCTPTRAYIAALASWFLGLPCLFVEVPKQLESSLILTSDDVDSALTSPAYGASCCDSFNLLPPNFRTPTPLSSLDVAYFCYTSGTTSAPKAIATSGAAAVAYARARIFAERLHRGFCTCSVGSPNSLLRSTPSSLLTWPPSVSPTECGYAPSVIACASGSAFDPFVADLITALVGGVGVCAGTPATAASVAGVRAMAALKVTHCTTTPLIAKAMSQAAASLAPARFALHPLWGAVTSLRVLCVGGEAMTPSTAALLCPPPPHLLDATRPSPYDSAITAGAVPFGVSGVECSVHASACDPRSRASAHSQRSHSRQLVNVYGLTEGTVYQTRCVVANTSQLLPSSPPAESPISPATTPPPPLIPAGDGAVMDDNPPALHTSTPDSQPSAVGLSFGKEALTAVGEPFAGVVVGVKVSLCAACDDDELATVHQIEVSKARDTRLWGDAAGSGGHPEGLQRSTQRQRSRWRARRVRSAPAAVRRWWETRTLFPTVGQLGGDGRGESGEVMDVGEVVLASRWMSLRVCVPSLTPRRGLDGDGAGEVGESGVTEALSESPRATVDTTPLSKVMRGNERALTLLVTGDVAGVRCDCRPPHSGSNTSAVIRLEDRDPTVGPRGCWCGLRVGCFQAARSVGWNPWGVLPLPFSEGETSDQNVRILDAAGEAGLFVAPAVAGGQLPWRAPLQLPSAVVGSDIVTPRPWRIVWCGADTSGCVAVAGRRLLLRGRKEGGDVVKVSGERVELSEVEQGLLAAVEEVVASTCMQLVKDAGEEVASRVGEVLRGIVEDVKVVAVGGGASSAAAGSAGADGHAPPPSIPLRLVAVVQRKGSSSSAVAHPCRGPEGAESGAEAVSVHHTTLLPSDDLHVLGVEPLTPFVRDLALLESALPHTAPTAPTRTAHPLSSADTDRVPPSQPVVSTAAARRDVIHLPTPPARQILRTLRAVLSCGCTCSPCVRRRGVVSPPPPPSLHPSTSPTPYPPSSEFQCVPPSLLVETLMTAAAERTLRASLLPLKVYEGAWALPHPCAPARGGVARGPHPVTPASPSTPCCSACWIADYISRWRRPSQSPPLPRTSTRSTEAVSCMNAPVPDGIEPCGDVKDDLRRGAAPSGWPQSRTGKLDRRVIAAAVTAAAAVAARDGGGGSCGARALETAGSKFGGGGSDGAAAGVKPSAPWVLQCSASFGWSTAVGYCTKTDVFDRVPTGGVSVIRALTHTTSSSSAGTVTTAPLDPLPPTVFTQQQLLTPTCGLFRDLGGDSLLALRAAQLTIRQIVDECTALATLGVVGVVAKVGVAHDRRARGTGSKGLEAQVAEAGGGASVEDHSGTAEFGGICEHEGVRSARTESMRAGVCKWDVSLGSKFVIASDGGCREVVLNSAASEKGGTGGVEAVTMLSGATLRVPMHPCLQDQNAPSLPPWWEGAAVGLLMTCFPPSLLVSFGNPTGSTSPASASAASSLPLCVVRVMLLWVAVAADSLVRWEDGRLQFGLSAVDVLSTQSPADFAQVVLKALKRAVVDAASNILLRSESTQCHQGVNLSSSPSHPLTLPSTGYPQCTQHLPQCACVRVFVPLSHPEQQDSNVPSVHKGEEYNYSKGLRSQGSPRGELSEATLSPHVHCAPLPSARLLSAALSDDQPALFSALLLAAPGGSGFGAVRVVDVVPQRHSQACDGVHAGGSQSSLNPCDTATLLSVDALYQWAQRCIMNAAPRCLHAILSALDAAVVSKTLKKANAAGYVLAHLAASTCASCLAVLLSAPQPLTGFKDFPCSLVHSWLLHCQDRKKQTVYHHAARGGYVASMAILCASALVSDQSAIEADIRPRIDCMLKMLAKVDGWARVPFTWSIINKAKVTASLIAWLGGTLQAQVPSSWHRRQTTAELETAASVTSKAAEEDASISSLLNIPCGILEEE